MRVVIEPLCAKPVRKDYYRVTIQQWSSVATTGGSNGCIKSCSW